MIIVDSCLACIAAGTYALIVIVGDFESMRYRE
jgi:hypothetical protein